MFNKFSKKDERSSGKVASYVGAIAIGFIVATQTVAIDASVKQGQPEISIQTKDAPLHVLVLGVFAMGASFGITIDPAVLGRLIAAALGQKSE